MTQTAVQWLVEQYEQKIGKGITKVMFDEIQQAKQMEEEQHKITENTSDGYHTFKELYEFRKAYNVVLFNEWGKYDIPYYDVHKS